MQFLESYRQIWDYRNLDKNKTNKLTLALESLGVLENLAKLAAALLELKAGVTGVLGVLGVAGVRVASGVMDSADPVFLRGLLLGVLGECFISSPAELSPSSSGAGV